MTPTLNFLVSERIILRPLQPEDSEGPYISWFNDEEVCSGNAHHVYPYTVEEARDYISMSHKTMQKHLILGIISKEDNTHIGNIALQNINPVVHSSELTIIIGEKPYWGNGYGKESCKLICNHGFMNLNLSRISCGTFETNIAMISIAKYLGMKEEGCRRKAAFKNGRYLDIIEYGILKTEYEMKWFGNKSG